MNLVNVTNQNLTIQPLQTNPCLEKFTGDFEATYWHLGWIPIYVPVELWVENNHLQAKVYGKTYVLFEDGDNKFTVSGIDDSKIIFKMKNDHVKKFTLYLPEYGEMKGKPV